jgi:hypothetical protein
MIIPLGWNDTLCYATYIVVIKKLVNEFQIGMTLDNNT